ncbi:MAG: signal peptidase I [Lachnospiraceae bacterium]
MDTFTKKILKVLGIYIVFAVIVLILFQTVFMLSFIPTGSMESTIKTNSVVFSTMYDVDEEDLERYDILTFIAPDDPDVTYIKRLIGLPGETIEVKDGKVYADGVELDDSFIKGSQNQVGDGIYEIPEGCYFFMGDNRNNSKDSRFWDNPYVPIDDIQAKAKYILFPFSDIGSLCYN